MAGQRMSCGKCRSRFTRAKGSSRLNCETCSPPRSRGKATAAPVVVDLPATDRVLGQVEQATLNELAAVERHETMAGALALLLARQLDVGLNTGSQAAALSRELRASTAAAIEGAPPVGDQLDELQKRRADRRAGLAG